MKIASRPAEPFCPVATFGDLTARLEDLTPRLRVHGAESLAIFNELYIVSQSGISAAAAAGNFENPAAVESLSAEFGNLYLRAMESLLACGDLPEPWSLANSNALHPYMVALIGANIHINHDLPLALRSSVGDVKDFQRDFYRMDQVFVGTSRRLFQSCAGMTRTRRVPLFLHSAIERGLCFLIVQWRHAAWSNHLRLRRCLLSPTELVSRNLRTSRRIRLTSKVLGFHSGQ